MLREEFGLEPSTANVSRARRAYHDWLEHTDHGINSAAGAGATERNRRRRTSDTKATERQLAPCIGFELFQWFIDFVFAWKCRSDARLVLDQARWYRQALVDHGEADAELPKIDKHWLFRWRLVCVDCIPPPANSTPQLRGWLRIGYVLILAA